MTLDTRMLVQGNLNTAEVSVNPLLIPFLMRAGGFPAYIHLRAGISIHGKKGGVGDEVHVYGGREGLQ
eukprot:1139640-Pelagomonas_calceolata.AAC.2